MPSRGAQSLREAAIGLQDAVSAQAGTFVGRKLVGPTVAMRFRASDGIVGRWSVVS
jgi:hypothetical protein